MHPRTRALALIAALALLGPIVVAPALPGVAATARAAGVPKVVVVVGPTHSLTASDLTWGEAIAQRAEAHGANVVRIFHPNATWENVVAQAQGANVFVYLGHGNGFPSPYSSTLMPDRQDGMGLNPVPGGSASTVKYVGEQQVVASLHLAPNAVVILNHLCYASGDSEPGQPDPTLAVAIARTDNYAAGFLAAGAGAVFALGHQDGGEILDGLFGPPQTIDGLFTSTGYTGTYSQVVPSTRTPGATIHLDPEGPSAYYRALTGNLGMMTSDVVGGSATTPTMPGSVAPQPTTPTTQPAPATPAGVLVIQPPDTTAAPGQSLGTVGVLVTDQAAAPLSGAALQIGIASGGAPGARLSCPAGTSTATAPTGVATFAGCSIDAASASPYTLRISSGRIAALVGPVLVHAPAGGSPGAASATIALAASSPAMNHSAVFWGQGVDLVTTGAPGTVFHVEASTDQATWTPIRDAAGAVRTFTIGANGSASFHYTPVRNYWYRSVLGIPGGTTVSPTVRVPVRQTFTVRPVARGSTPVTHGTPLSFAMTTRPTGAALPIGRTTVLAFQRQGSAWVLMATVDAVPDQATGVATMTWSFPSPGSWYLQFMARPTSVNANSLEIRQYFLVG